MALIVGNSVFPTTDMKILVADDDAATSLMLREMLRKWNHDVCAATDGHEAWALFCTPEPPQLAIIDWQMPGIEGPELCRRLKRGTRLPVPYLILLTARKDHEDIARGLDAGADDFMIKPFHAAELRARINAGSRILALQQSILAANEQLEERVLQRTREAERLMKFRESLLQHLSHDLKTPLTPLLSMLSLLRETEPDAERRQMLDLALGGTRTIHELAGGVLDLCHVEAALPALSPTGEKLRTMLTAVLAQCAAEHELAGRSLRNEIPDDLCVRPDPIQMRRALGCLVENAIHATSETGQITIRATADAGWATVTVADDGVGLEEHQLQDIFEPFYKTDESRHDLSAPGLGLAIARVIIERYGGWVRAESAGRGRGTTFRFTLPLSNIKGETIDEKSFGC